MRRTLAALVTLSPLIAGSAAFAGQISYSGYTILDEQSGLLSVPAWGERITGTAGQITFTGVSGAGVGSTLSAWSIDITQYLLPSGSFTTGGTVGGTFGQQLNALLAHATPLLYSSHDASAAVQAAIWEMEYGPLLTLTGSLSVQAMATTFMANVNSGLWAPDANMQVALLDGGGANQNAAYLIPIPEPVSAALLATGTLGFWAVRRRRR